MTKFTAAAQLLILTAFPWFAIAFGDSDPVYFASSPSIHQLANFRVMQPKP